jgi:hypothetical protein
MQTIQCPNCGAAATNLKNCEFCGSLFVRYEATGLSRQGLFSEQNQFTGFIFHGLENFLLENLDEQKNGHHWMTNINHQYTVQPDGSFLDIAVYNPASGIPGSKNHPLSAPPALGIDLSFWQTSSNKIYESAFLRLPESKLFRLTFDDPELRVYNIDFGNDALGAGYLISLILIKVYGIPQNDTRVSFSNVEMKEIINKSSTNCFIATAAMGSYDHPLVMELRRFRDGWILKKSWGNKFVKAYYRYGSIVAKKIEKSILLRKLSYLLVVKPVLFISRIVHRK